MADTEPAWLTKARGYVGFHERPGNQGIEEFIALAHTGSRGDPWCAIFANGMLEGVGVPGTRSAMARSFEHSANFIRLSKAILGCIATMWRGSPSSGQGHVGFYVGQDSRGVLFLDGNSSDEVGIHPHPSGQITGYWWPKSVPLSGEAAPVVPTGAHRFTGITATVFGGSADRNTSAYDEHLITDTEMGVSLPARVKSPRPKVRVFKNGRSVDCTIVDVGPWNINDPYWETGARPQAETGTDHTGRHTNHAGIDLTPAPARALGIDGKGVVDWEFVSETPMPDQPTQNPIEIFRPQSDLFKTVADAVMQAVMADLQQHPEKLQAILGRIIGQPSAAAAAADPAVPAAPAQPSKLGFGTGILATLLSGALMHQGVIPPATGTGSTIMSFLSLAVPAALSVFGAGGGVAGFLLPMARRLIGK